MMSPRYKQAVEKYKSTYNASNLDGIRSLLQKTKRCGDKTRTFACFFHLQEIAALSEMALHDHMAGKRLLSTFLIFNSHNRHFLKSFSFIADNCHHQSSLSQISSTIIFKAREDT